jgi:predicted TIM-barrel fold metal-dependent hydrolase
MTVKLDPSRREFLTKGGKILAGGVVSQFVGGPEGAGLSAAEQQRKTPVIDCHAHVGIARLPGTSYDLTDPWYTVADPEQILRHAEEAGIDVTVIFPIENVTYEEANKAVAEICRQHPRRFVGFAKHDPVIEQGRIRDLLTRECHELGLRGLKLHKQPSKEVLDTVKELGIPVLYHPKRVSLYEEFLPYYPTLNFILAHLGSDQSKDWNEHLAAIELAKRFPNVYLDTSTVVLTQYLEKAIRELPAERLVFGSDEPEVDCRMEIFKIRVLNLPKEKEELILGGNMLRLLGDVSSWGGLMDRTQ